MIAPNKPASDPGAASKVATPVNIIILNDHNQILLIKRAEKEDQYFGHWSIPGGGPKFGESYEQALVREVKEELGAELLDYRYFNSYFFIVNPRLYVRAIYFFGKINNIINLGEEGLEYRWFNADDIKKLDKIAFNQKEVLLDFIQTLQ